MDPADRSMRLLSLVDAFASKRVLVVGDLIADEFIYGEVSRVSREAPVLILKYDTTEIVPGGAGNAANNVAALGARASLAGMVGTDPEGKRLMSTFPRTVDVRQVVRASHYRTPVKTRILAGGVHSAKQQVVRMDRVSRGGPDAKVRAAQDALARAGVSAADVDLVIVGTDSPDYITPSTSVVVQDKLGAKKAGTFDVGCACASFPTAIANNVVTIRRMSRAWFNTPHDPLASRAGVLCLGDRCGDGVARRGRHAPPIG